MYKQFAGSAIESVTISVMKYDKQKSTLPYNCWIFTKKSYLLKLMLMENDQIWIEKKMFMPHTTHTVCKSGHLGEYLNADVLFHLLANISKTFFFFI